MPTFFQHILMMEKEKKNSEKYSFRVSWKSLKTRSKIYQVVVHLFAAAGFAILGAWAFYQMGFTKNRGAVDHNNRYLADYKSIDADTDSAAVFEENMRDYLDLVAMSKFYPVNAHLITDAGRFNFRNDGISQMIYAANMYLKEDGSNRQYQKMVAELRQVYGKYTASNATENLIPWMNEPAWAALKEAIVKDKEAILQASEITGVEPRLIVGCLVGEQIRLFNSKREMFKKYLGPVKVLSVQSQFSFGVNGIKDFTAAKVESNLKDTASPFYMGKKYEHILDFSTDDHTTERMNRLIDYHHHLYSYIYTGCILHQTMLQWKRAGYDISGRPDILFTLFNLGFAASNPRPDPQCGGSHITVNDRVYTFGIIGNDFYFSGELAEEFPLQAKSFADE